ncbi:hypothetical protein GCM10027446_20430 [Angustibacter peucedani]
MRDPAGGDPAPRPGTWTAADPAPPCTDDTKEPIMSEAEEYARRALQESMDLRDQGHSDD